MAEERSEVRVRMAPGPTGAFHIGRSRTALLNWLFARHFGGTFVLRIEDTDVQRSRPEHLQSILDSLRWLGLNWDEGPEVGGPYAPYFQMGRLNTYAHYAQQLRQEGHAYPCYCTAEELDVLREQAKAAHRPFRYPGTCRNLTADERQAREAAGQEPVLRLRMPDEGATSFDDLLLGEITIQNAELDDFVIMRANGIPTYNFAVVVDDITMKITHVIRGQEHIANTPRQVVIYHYLGAPTPAFVHLPMVLGMDRSKLSARHGAAPVTTYGEDGFLPEAIFNYLATLGVTYDPEREIFSREELVRLFDLQRVSKSGGVFSDEKLEWMNGVYIRALGPEEFVRRSLPFLQVRGLVSPTPSEDELAYVSRALALEQERVRTLAETPEAVEFFLASELDYDPALLVVKRSSPEDARRVLHAAADLVAQVNPFTVEQLEPAFRALATQLELKTGVVFGTIRVAVTGRTAAPPLFDTMAVLGRERVAERLGIAAAYLDEWGRGSVG